MDTKKAYAIYKWRSLDSKEVIIGAHLRLDRVEKVSGFPYLEPDLKDIANKLQEEATDKKEYTPQGSVSFFPEFITKGWVKANDYFNHFINCIFRSKQRKGQNQTTNKGNDKTNDSQHIGNIH
jgi:hypothetical protein